jgi:hypothetical protein
MISSQSYAEAQLTQYQQQLRLPTKKLLTISMLVLIVASVYLLLLIYGEATNGICKRVNTSSNINSPHLLQKGTWLSDVALTAPFAKDPVLYSLILFRCH